MEADPTPGSPDGTSVLAGTLESRAGEWLDTADGLLALGRSGMVVCTRGRIMTGLPGCRAS